MTEPKDKSFNFDGPEKIDASVLETFAYEYAGRDAEIEIADGGRVNSVDDNLACVAGPAVGQYEHLGEYLK